MILAWPNLVPTISKVLLLFIAMHQHQLIDAASTCASPMWESSAFPDRAPPPPAVLPVKVCPPRNPEKQAKQFPPSVKKGKLRLKSGKRPTRCTMFQTRSLHI
jgi:hypothetical protein